MASYSSDRRSLLKVIGAIGATCAYPFASDDLYGQTTQPAHVHSSVPPPEAGTRFFNAADFATISRIADLIIPPTDTPGASGAGVPAYIDLVISRNADHQAVIADGLRWLDGQAKKIANRTFIELNETQQLGLLKPLCDEADAGRQLARNVQFFGLIKSLTADGYYTSRVGLMDELRYAGNSARSQYPECTDVVYLKKNA